MEVEFQAQPEHQHNDADLAPGLDGHLVRHREEIGHIRPYEEASQDIPQHQGQLEAFEQNGHHARRQQHDRQIRDQFRHAAHFLSASDGLLSIIPVFQLFGKTFCIFLRFVFFFSPRASASSVYKNALSAYNQEKLQGGCA